MKKRKMRKLPKLKGEIPYIYKPSTIYEMGILINALVDAVNYLAERVEALDAPKDGDT